MQRKRKNVPYFACVPLAASGVYSLTPMVKRIVHAFMTAAEQQWTLWCRYVLTWKLAGRTTGPH